jgi:hypothetical protein
MVITPRVHLTLTECNLIVEALRALPAFRQYHAPMSSPELSELVALRDYLAAAFDHAQLEQK